MIKLEHGDVPAVLQAHAEEWGLEYEAAINSTAGNPTRYRHPQIRSALERDTAQKCAYCESLIAAVAYEHIEHILPKELFPRLVCDWDNLTLACPRCNINKGTYYNPRARLLNPYVDDVEREVTFLGPMAIHTDATSRTTIAKLQLNRSGLLFERSKKIQSLKDLAERISTLPDGSELREALLVELQNELANSAEFASCGRQFVTEAITPHPT